MTPDPAELSMRPSSLPGLFDVGCGRCGGTAVLEGDQPGVQQLAGFHLLHGGCPPAAHAHRLPLPR